MMASNSRCVPRVTSPEPKVRTCITETRHAAAAVLMKRRTRTVSVFTPMFRAATGLSPVLKIQLPNRVFIRTHVPTPTIAIHHSTASEKSPTFADQDVREHRVLLGAAEAD